jgi:hypothetical protein
MIDKSEFHTHANFFLSHGLRTGQSYMNALCELDKELCNKIIDTEFDCYYDDKKIDAFMERVFG